MSLLVLAKYYIKFLCIHTLIIKVGVPETHLPYVFLSNGVQLVSIKRECSQEGNLVPYMIQPMAELPSKVKKKKVKIGGKRSVSTFII